jgi:hypothetical protein
MVRSHAAAGASPKGALNSWKSSFLAQLSDDAIDTMVEPPMGQCCSSISTALQLRVGVSDTAFPHRSDPRALGMLRCSYMTKRITAANYEKTAPLFSRVHAAPRATII